MSRLFRQQVPVYFNGKSLFVKNVTKYTTCSDVVHMLVLKLELPLDKISSFALFEGTGDIERMLQSRTRITKTIRSWGCEKDNFKFILKEIENDKACMVKEQCDALDNMAHSTGDKDVDTNDLLHSPLQVKGKVNNLTNNDSLVKYAVKKSLKQNLEQFNTSSGQKNTNRKKLMKRIMKGKDDKESLGGNNSKVQKKSEGKKAIFQKCFRDLISLGKTKRNLKRSAVRETGDGADSEEEYLPSNIRFVDGADLALETQFRTLRERCRYYWNSNSESDDESDVEGGEGSFTDLNHAFMKTVREDYSVNRTDISSIYSSDLNTAFIHENRESRDISKLFEFIDDTDVSISDISSCELEQNITSCDVVRNIFCGQSPGGDFSEDEAMDSFMRTRIMDSDSDESF